MLQSTGLPSKRGPGLAQQKVISYARVSAITQEPNENPIAFLERLKEALQKFTKQGEKAAFRMGEDNSKIGRAHV